MVYSVRCMLQLLIAFRKNPMSLDVSLIVGGEEVYSRNITHNLNKMAEAAGIYQHLWRPDEIGVTHARELIAPLQQGVSLLARERERFEAFNSPNGWGLYENFVPFVADYLAACARHPDAKVEVSR